MARFVSDAIRIMRLAIARRNENDPDSNDDTILSYLNDAISLTMSDDVKVFEQFDTLEFVIDENNTTGVYTFNDVGADADFVNISSEAFISLSDPPNASVSWNQLEIYQNPGDFYYRWGVDNTEILVPGYPTEMLYYGTEMVFRTIPNTSYNVKIFGYKQTPNFTPDADQPIPFDYWLRYVAYLAAWNYAKDYNFDEQKKANLKASYLEEKKHLLTRTHNQIKMARAMPRF